MGRGIKGGALGRKFLWLALFFGILCGLENHYQLLRLVELTVEPPGSLPETVLWKSVGSLSRRFWILPMMRRSAIARELGERYPAEIKITSPGWGRIGIAVRPYVPWLSLSYEGREYILSAEGFIWPKHFSVGTGKTSAEGQRLQSWEWDKQLLNPFIDPNRRDSSVQKSSLPIAEIRQWEDSLAGKSWLGNRIRTVVFARGGQRYLKVIAQRNNQRIQLELKDDPRDWEAVFAAVKGILSDPDLSKQGILVIDATYEGKIVARMVSPDGTGGKRLRPEGSESN